jgi:hypothetical protein
MIRLMVTAARFCFDPVHIRQLDSETFGGDRWPIELAYGHKLRSDVREVRDPEFRLLPKLREQIIRRAESN